MSSHEATATGRVIVVAAIGNAVATVIPAPVRAATHDVTRVATSNDLRAVVAAANAATANAGPNGATSVTAGRINRRAKVRASRSRVNGGPTGNSNSVASRRRDPSNHAPNRLGRSRPQLPCHCLWRARSRRQPHSRRARPRVRLRVLSEPIGQIVWKVSEPDGARVAAGGGGGASRAKYRWVPNHR